MNSLSLVRRRALVAATLTMGSSLLLVLLYWRAVSGGCLPSPAQPLVAASQPIHSNGPVAKVLALSPASVPTSPATSAAEKPAPLPVAAEAASTAPTAKASVSEAFDRTAERKTLMPTNATAVATNSPRSEMAANPARTETAKLAMDVTAEDERVARLWLADTNHRPAIKVRYEPADILRLSTDIRRGLLVAGNGSTNRHEVFLQANSAKAPLFDPLTKAISEQFSSFALALGSSVVFEDIVRPLPAYFANGSYDLAFVPDRALATQIFAQAASVLRSLQADGASNRVVFEGQLRLVEGGPVFSVLTVKQGTNVLSFARN